jgi:hypothetical protein
MRQIGHLVGPFAQVCFWGRLHSGVGVGVGYKEGGG